MDVIPAILPKDFKEIEDKVESIKGLSNIVQIDICDGKFVSNTTWPYKKKDENFEMIIKEEKGMPFWDSIDYEFDLMIDNPNTNDVRNWLSAGATRIVLHFESSNDLNPIIDILSGLVELGIAINTKTSIDDIDKYINKIQYIQFMGIENIGFQGQKFESNVIDVVKNFKNIYPNIPIQIDGGVTLENAPLLKHIGVDRLIIGSSIFESSNIVDIYNKFKRI